MNANKLRLGSAVLLLAGAVVLGGGSTGEPYLEMALVVLAAACFLVAVWSPSGRAGPGPGIHAIIALLIALPLIQLVPLPPAIWHGLPGRAPEAAVAAALGQAQAWRPISLSPDGTVHGLLWAGPMLAMMWLCASFGRQQRQVILSAFLALAALSAVLGIAQVAGVMSLELHEHRHSQVAIGFFANRNHFADFLLMAIPVAFALRMSMARRFRDAAVGNLVFGALLMLLVAAVIATASRTAAALLLPVLACSGLSLVTRARRKAMLAGGAVVGLLGAAGLWWLPQTGALGVLASRFEQAEEARWQIWRNSWDAALAYWPAGGGLGSFQAVYGRFEAVEDVTSHYINAAHNDYLQALIEGGLPIILIAGLIALLVYRRLRADGFTDERKAMLIGLAVPLAHSVVDYPLRTQAVGVVAAAMLAFVLRRQEPGAGRS